MMSRCLPCPYCTAPFVPLSNKFHTDGIVKGRCSNSRCGATRQGTQKFYMCLMCSITNPTSSLQSRFPARHITSDLHKNNLQLHSQLNRRSCHSPNHSTQPSTTTGVIPPNDIADVSSPLLLGPDSADTSSTTCTGSDSMDFSCGVDIDADTSSTTCTGSDSMDFSCHVDIDVDDDADEDMTVTSLQQLTGVCPPPSPNNNQPSLSVGTHVYKIFEDDIEHHGIVIGEDTEKGTELPIFLVKYDDGQTEDLYREEVLSLKTPKHRLANDYAYHSKQDFIQRLEARSPPVTLEDSITLPLQGFDQVFAHKSSNGTGAQFFVRSTFAKKRAADPEAVIDDTDCLFHVSVANFAGSLLPKQLSTYVAHLQYVANNHHKVCIPTSLGDLGTRWSRADKKYSLRSNLPQPRACMVTNSSYAYQSIEEIICYLFVMGKAPHPFGNIKGSIHGITERGRQLLDDSNVQTSDIAGHMLYNIELILWSDGFPHSAFNNSGVHVLLATIGGKEGDHHRGKNTHIIWCGHSKKEQHAVQLKLKDELNRLGRGLNSHNEPFLLEHYGTKRIVHVRTCLYAWLADIPDKAAMTMTLDGGNSHRRYGYAGVFKTEIKKIVPCDACYNKLCIISPTEAVTNIGSTCSRCNCFHISRMTFQAPEHYPLSVLSHNRNSKLPFQKLSWSNGSLQATRKDGWEGIVNQNWTNQNLSCYVKTHGLNDNCVLSIQHHADNKKTLNEANNPDSRMSTLERNLWRDHFRTDPSSFQLPPTTPIHEIEQLDVHDFVCGVGHQIFLGVMKSLLLDVIAEVIAASNTKRYFLTNFQRKLKVVEQLHHDLFPVLAVCKTKDKSPELTVTGWFCRHFVTVARISKWLLSHTPSVEQTEEEKILLGKSCPTHTAYRLFQHNEIERWCIRRDVDISSMPHDHVRRKQWFLELMEKPSKLFNNFHPEEIQRYLRDEHPKQYEIFRSRFHDMEELIPDFNTFINNNGLVPTDITDKPPRDTVDHSLTIEIISLFVALACRVMGSCGHQADPVERYTKLFLTKIHHYDNACMSKKAEGILLRKTNYLTLLNLSENINRYGHLRFLWELGGMGEGFIPRLKRWVNHLQQDFGKHAMRKVSELQSYSDLTECLLLSIKNLEEKDIFHSEKKSQQLLQDVCAESIVEEAKFNGLYAKATHLCDEPFGLKNVYYDREGNAPKPLDYSQYKSLLNYQVEAAPILLSVKTNAVYVFVKVPCGQKSTKQLFRLKIDTSSLSQMVYTFGACYFKLQGVHDDPLSSQDATIVCGELDSGLMLQHRQMKQWYYFVSRDWTELTIPDTLPASYDKHNKNTEQHLFRFASPTSYDVLTHLVSNEHLTDKKNHLN